MYLHIPENICKVNIQGNFFRTFLTESPICVHMIIILFNNDTIFIYVLIVYMCNMCMNSILMTAV